MNQIESWIRIFETISKSYDISGLAKAVEETHKVYNQMINQTSDVNDQ